MIHTYKTKACINVHKRDAFVGGESILVFLYGAKCRINESNKLNFNLTKVHFN